MSERNYSVLAGLIEDKWNLGFVVVTENQVMSHLDEQLNEITFEGNDEDCLLGLDNNGLDDS